MAQDLSAKSYRHLADECIREAKAARFDEIREGYEKLSGQWLKLAEEIERLNRGGA
jgi:hypothetical protein